MARQFRALLVAVVAAISSIHEIGADLKVVIDTDVGADDAMAMLIMLSKRSNANVMAITTVGGNTGVENATRGALLVLQVANHTEIPVYMGDQHDMEFESDRLHYYFGYDGLGDVFDKPPLFLKQDTNAASALVSLVKENPGEISLLCIGPLTNIARAIHIHPELLMDLKEVVILGGSYKGAGTIRPGVEFNMYVDPEAAAFVFSTASSSKMITLVPKETIEENGFTKSWRLNNLGGVDSSFMRFLNKAEGFALSSVDDSWAAYDQTAAFILLDPTIVTWTVDARVDVVTKETDQTFPGAMVVNNQTSSPNVKIVTAVDRDSLVNMFFSYLQD